MTEWIAPISLILLSIGVFLPAARFGFSNWDDPGNLVENPSFRGLSPAHFRWFFTTYHMDHYQPLTWLSYGLDYRTSGLDPQRFHFTHVLLHSLAVLCIYLLIRDLLAICNPDVSTTSICASAALATALFAVHPLRAESVAWLSGRMDVLAAIFGCLSVAANLRHSVSRQRGWWWASLALFVFGLLSKEMVVTVPVVCLILRRWLWNNGRLPQSGSFWRETAADLGPFFLVALAAGVNAIFAAGSSLSAPDSTNEHSAHFIYSLVFYVRKTFWPTQLSPFYEFPGRFGWRDPEVLYSLLALIAMILLIARNSHRASGLIAAAICYFVVILPIGGLAQRGGQLVADRYTYIGTIPIFASLAFFFLRRWRRWSAVVITGVVAILILFVPVTRAQVNIWSDPVNQWTHAIALDSHNGTAHANLAHAYELLHRDDDAIREYRTALLIRPTHPNVHRNLAAILSRKGRLEEAIPEYQAEIKQNPGRAASRYYLGAVYQQMQRPEDAAREYRAALDVDPRFAPAEVGLARLDLQIPDERRAEPHLRRALDIDGNNADALELLAQVCERTDRAAEAIQLYDRLIAEVRRRGSPDSAKKLEAIRDRLAHSSTRPASSP